MIAPKLAEVEVLLQALIRFALKDPTPAKYHITRFGQYMALENSLAGMDSPDKTYVSISNSVHFANTCGIVQAKPFHANWPDYDLLNLNIPDNSHDFLFADQILEHLTDPFKAMAETYRVLKPGGVAVHSTCMINQIHHAAPEDIPHGAPKDFYRFTPMGLDFLAKNAGFKVIQTAGAGSKLAWSYIALGFRSQKIPHNPQNPIYQLGMLNEPEVPISTWVIAQKPL